MGLTDQQVREFRELYRKAFGKEISTQRAQEMGTLLLVTLKAMVQVMEKKGKTS